MKWAESIRVVRVLGFVQAETVVCLQQRRQWQKIGKGLLPAAKGLSLGGLADQMEWARV